MYATTWTCFATVHYYNTYPQCPLSILNWEHGNMEIRRMPVLLTYRLFLLMAKKDIYNLFEIFSEQLGTVGFQSLIECYPFYLTP